MTQAVLLGRRVRELREAMGLIQEDAAAQIGLARSTLTGIELGKAMPGRQTLEALASFFKVPHDFLAAKSPLEQEKPQIVNDPDELAWLSLWRDMRVDERAFALRLLRGLGDAPDK